MNNLRGIQNKIIDDFLINNMLKWRVEMDNYQKKIKNIVSDLHVTHIEFFIFINNI